MTSNIPTDHVTLPWVSESLPPFNRLVLAYMSGIKHHTDARWKRTGFAFMVRHDDDLRHVTADKWSRSHYEDALKRLDADFLQVTHWIALEAPRE